MAPGVAHSLFHVMIPTQEHPPAVMICISAMLMRDTVLTITTAMFSNDYFLQSLQAHIENTAKVQCDNHI